MTLFMARMEAEAECARNSVKRLHTLNSDNSSMKLLTAMSLYGGRSANTVSASKLENAGAQ